MSSTSSTADSFCCMWLCRQATQPHCRTLLHLVEHVRKRRLELERLLDLVRTHIWVFAVFEETRAMMFADELDERRGIGLPVLGKAFQVFEDCVEARTGEN